jgi:uncharacterized membrane protein YeiH
VIVFFLSPVIQRRRNLIQVFDAFGLGVFTAIGAAKDGLLKVKCFFNFF